MHILKKIVMRKIKITIERSKDMFTAYSENVKGLTGGGDTVVEAKQSLLDCLEILKELGQLPKALENEFELVYKFDTQSLLDYYKGIFTNSALEKITGINQRLIQHYASGLKKPRPLQAKKIENALHQLGSELMSVEL
jgi:hypothetical protein